MKRKYLWILLLVFVATGIGGRRRYRHTSSNLIAHYKMDDNAASATVVDSTGNHNGTFKDAAGDPNTDAHDATGKINGALDFDGTDDYVEVADHADFTPISTPFSISGWIRADSSLDAPLVSKGLRFPNGEWQFGPYDDDYLYFTIVDKDAGASISRNGNLSAFYDTLGWLHIVGTYDGGTSSSGIKIYVNSERIDKSSTPIGTFVAVDAGTGYAVWIGRDGGGYTDALIDDVKFFNKELTLREVRKLYRPGRRGRGRY